MKTITELAEETEPLDYLGVPLAAILDVTVGRGLPAEEAEDIYARVMARLAAHNEVELFSAFCRLRDTLENLVRVSKAQLMALADAGAPQPLMNTFLGRALAAYTTRPRRRKKKPGSRSRSAGQRGGPAAAAQ